MRIRPIHHVFAPHVNASYAARALGNAFVPWHLRKGNARREFTRELEKHFGMRAFGFGSGREALLALFRGMKLHAGEEIIVQAYTCVVIPNAIHAAGGVPVYADIGRETLNLNIDDVQRKITPRTRAVICQHTFGIPADTKALRELCDAHGLLLIEDLAHVIPEETGDIGSHGDAIMLSFGRDKAISGVLGGAILVKDKALADAVETQWQQAREVPFFLVLRAMLYPLFYLLIKATYGIGIGKALLKIAGNTRLLPPILREEEKEGAMDLALHRLPNACASLARWQFRNLHALNEHRRMLTEFYLLHLDQTIFPPLHSVTSASALQKYPLFLAGADAIRTTLKQKNIHLKDGWTGCVVCPDDADEGNANYEKGTDPVAENACMRILSLPTHPTMSLRQADDLVQALAETVAAAGGEG